MPHITTWDGLLVASGRDELIGNFDHYTKPDMSYANKEIRPFNWIDYFDLMEIQGEDRALTPFEVNKEVVSIQDHNRFNPGPFQKGSAIYPGHGVIAEDHSAGSFEPRQAKLLEADRYQGPGNEVHPRFTETFEPAAGMNSFGESLNPVLELGTNSGPGGSTFMTGQFEMPTDNVGGQSGPGGTTF